MQLNQSLSLAAASQQVRQNCQQTATTTTILATYKQILHSKQMGGKWTEENELGPLQWNSQLFVFMSQQKIFTSSFGCLCEECGQAAVWSPWKHFFPPPFVRPNGRMKQMLHVTYGRQAGAAHSGNVDRISNRQTGGVGVVLCYFTLLRCSKPLSGTRHPHTQEPFIRGAEAQRRWV